MKHNNSLKVATDMFFVKMSWTFGFLGVMLVIQLVRAVTAILKNSEVDSYFNAVFVAGGIFMFVVGIISTYFLPYYVEHGVTRKDFFRGAFLSSIGLSIALPVITLIISTGWKFILNLFNITIKDVNFNTVVDSEPHLIGGIVQSFIINPYIDPTSNWPLALITFAANLFIYFLVGWLIGAAFYRNILVGFVFIVIGVVIVTVKDSLLRVALELPLSNEIIAIDQLSPTISAFGLLLIIILTVLILRQLTKRVSIKM